MIDTLVGLATDPCVRKCLMSFVVGAVVCVVAMVGLFLFSAPKVKTP